MRQSTVLCFSAKNYRAEEHRTAVKYPKDADTRRQARSDQSHWPDKTAVNSVQTTQLKQSQRPVYCRVLFFPLRNSPSWTRAPSLSRLHDHTEIHYTRCDSSGQVISPSQRPVPDNKQHSQQTDKHAPPGTL